jgi:hypothetical protein
MSVAIIWLGAGMLDVNPAAAQAPTAPWTIRGATTPNRYDAWTAATSTVHPKLAIGASSLAFGPENQLYLASEKFPILLAFPNAAGVAPTVIPLTGIPNVDDGVDLEAMSVHDGQLYLLDEDVPEGTKDPLQLSIYQTSASYPGPVRTLTVQFAKHVGFDNSSLDRDPTNYSSIEGLVVVGKRIGTDPAPPADGPWFYLLDERDRVAGKTYLAKLYLGRLAGDRIEVTDLPVEFPLGTAQHEDNAFRMTDLFLHAGQLYALRTRFKPGKYEVVWCDLTQRTLVTVVDFTQAAPLTSGKYNSNYEGAAVDPKTGRLFLTADNERLGSGSNGPPTADGNSVTPLIYLPGTP